ncbi:M23 family metallopeptidase [Reinekea thalattae]|uniref:M23 family metallopeptidase n=1 Tax=Reinekea thalattae TaxID=2593301 RepID=A0A5C8Z452_9GAMM|nr:M23 family metallopeptidase [Reinekea thalattae]TXR52003.1 M23 family metallopeptidase [Reinekea thalattae]
MNIIVVSRKSGHSKTITAKVMLSVLLVAFALVGTAFIGVYRFITEEKFVIINEDVAQEWQFRMESHSSEVERTRLYTEEQINALRVKMVELQGRLTRLDALGQRLVDVAGLDEGEFDFSMPVAVGGPETPSIDYEAPDFVGILDDLAASIDNRNQQLKVLNSLLGDREIQSETFVAGRPIVRGWMSSRYGYRNDPFTGKKAWHDGLDFAGKEGSDIIAVASGVVTWAGPRYGYGNLVEVNHGNGYVTRYAHCQEILVSVGDVVKKTDVVALMGSTGRSTGPHVHFEVRIDGKSVDPNKYINRVARF